MQHMSSMLPFAMPEKKNSSYEPQNTSKLNLERPFTYKTYSIASFQLSLKINVFLVIANLIDMPPKVLIIMKCAGNEILELIGKFPFIMLRVRNFFLLFLVKINAIFLSIENLIFLPQEDFLQQLCTTKTKKNNNISILSIK